MRAVRLTYVDSASGKKEATRWAFIQEEPLTLAARMNGRILKHHRRRPDDLEPLPDRADRASSSTSLATPISRSARSTTSSCSASTTASRCSDRARLRFLGRGERALRHGPIRSCRSHGARPAVPRVLRAAGEFPKVFALFNAKKDSIYALYRDPIGKLLPADVTKRDAQVFRRLLQDDQQSEGRQERDHGAVPRRQRMTSGAATNDRRVAAAMISFRCELLSADQLAVLASGPLPSGLVASQARRELHRDLYLDTSDDSLGRRGIVCRLRTRADGEGTLILRVASSPLNLEVATHGADVREALGGAQRRHRRLRGIVDPSALERARRSRGRSAHAIRAHRLAWPPATRRASRPRQCSAERPDWRRRAYFQMCAHRLRGGETELADLVRALEKEHGVRASRLARANARSWRSSGRGSTTDRARGV